MLPKTWKSKKYFLYHIVVEGKISLIKDEDIENQPEQYKDDTSSTGSANQVIELLQVRLYLLSKMIV